MDRLDSLPEEEELSPRARLPRPPASPAPTHHGLCDPRVPGHSSSSVQQELEGSGASLQHSARLRSSSSVLHDWEAGRERSSSVTSTSSATSAGGPARLYRYSGTGQGEVV